MTTYTELGAFPIPISEVSFQRRTKCLTPVGGSPLEGRSHFPQYTKAQYTKKQYTEKNMAGQRMEIPLGTSTAGACGHPEGEGEQCSSEPRT